MKRSLSNTVGMNSAMRGLTIVEVLVVFAVLAVLVAIVTPNLGVARKAARDVDDLSRVRQIGLSLSAYANDYKDLAPTLFRPTAEPVGPATPNMKRWFLHTSLGFQPLVDAGLPGAVLQARGAPLQTSGASIAMGQLDFQLSATLYAAPKFFNLDTRSGLPQYGAQQISSVLFPSSKGLLRQVYTFTSTNERALACCALQLPSAIGWADGGVSAEVQMQLIPGVVNPDAGSVFSLLKDPRTIRGTPVTNTRDGLLGRDR